MRSCPAGRSAAATPRPACPRGTAAEPGSLLDRDRAGGAAALLQVALVVLLGPVERRRRGELGDDGPLQGLLGGIAGLDRGGLLGLVVEEDGRAVLAAQVEPLAVAGGRVVDVPERLEQLGVADLRRVEPHLARLGVAGAVPANLPVGRVRGVPAGVADCGPQHPGYLPERRLDAPETAGRERRTLGAGRPLALEGRGRCRTAFG